MSGSRIEEAARQDMEYMAVESAFWRALVPRFERSRRTPALQRELSAVGVPPPGSGDDSSIDLS